MKLSLKNLSLEKEMLRSLTEVEAQRVVGGDPVTGYCSCIDSTASCEQYTYGCTRIGYCTGPATYVCA